MFAGRSYLTVTTFCRSLLLACSDLKVIVNPPLQLWKERKKSHKEHYTCVHQLSSWINKTACVFLSRLIKRDNINMNALHHKRGGGKKKRERNTTSGYNSSSNQGFSVTYILFLNGIYICPNVQVYVLFLSKCYSAYAAAYMPQQRYQLSRSHVRVSPWKNVTIAASSCNL